MRENTIAQIQIEVASEIFSVVTVDTLYIYRFRSSCIHPLLSSTQLFKFLPRNAQKLQGIAIFAIKVYILRVHVFQRTH